VVAFVAFTRHILSMPVAPRHSSSKKPPASTVPALERSAAARVASLLSPAAAKSRGALQVVDAKGHRLDLPARLADVVYRAAELLAEGRAVAVLPDEEMLTTQHAADILNVSRQYLVRLVDAGELAAEKVGSHRRLRASDVAAYKAVRDAKRMSALDRLAAASEDADGYALDDSSR
jgi:excisionase family DNA binding protein